MSEKTSGSHSPGSINTLIGPSTRIEGDIRCPGVLRVQGEIHGNVACDASLEGALVVDSAGSVEGAVRATHIAVRGRVTGPLQSSESIEIHQGGSVAGDLFFKQLAIHAGGVVEGSLKPMPPPERSGVSQEAPAPATAGKAPERPAVGRGSRHLGVAAAIAVIAIAAAWMGRDLLPFGAPAPADDAPRAEAAPPPAPARLPEPQKENRSPEALGSAAAEPAEPASSQPADAQGQVLVVRGANPSRPAGVFLLISNDPSVLYRKKQDDPGEGARIVVAAGEKASVSIDADELIRIEKGSDVTIFYQGQKVPRQTIASGSWIRFVAR